ncbi:MAG: protein kinase [Deltaproteobacteria bacterium]|nr:protein kinase [Deltaproteobacteria bacterium]
MVAQCVACRQNWPAGTRECPHDGTALPQASELEFAKTLIAPLSSDSSSPSSSESVGLAAGSILAGEYRIERKLGEGSAGSVFAATHTVLGKRAAIKVLARRSSTTDREGTDRLLAEARAVNEIGHPNIIEVYSFGTLETGQPYIVMDWLIGESLRDRMNRGKMPLSEVAHVTSQVAGALEAAHQKNVVHRDLKPDNVFLVSVAGDRSLVKLLDFGIAMLGGAKQKSSDAPAHSNQGYVVGTPLYMSPEQALAGDVDARTDVYALGVMLFEMVLGRLPFQGGNAMEIIKKHLNEEPPRPISIWPEIPITLDRLICQMMDKDRAQRPSLREVRGRMDEVLEARDTTVRMTLETAASRPQPKRKRSVALGLLAVLMAVALPLYIGAFAREGERAKAADPLGRPYSVIGVGVARPSDAAREIGTLVVRVGIPSARITVDGRVVVEEGEEGRVEVDGDAYHEVQVTAPGYRQFSTAVRVRPGERVELPLQLVAEAVPPQARRRRDRPSVSPATRPESTPSSVVPAPAPGPQSAPANTPIPTDDNVPIDPFAKRRQ